jgi:hypothetical protein
MFHGYTSSPKPKLSFDLSFTADERRKYSIPTSEKLTCTIEGKRLEIASDNHLYILLSLPPGKNVMLIHSLYAYETKGLMRKLLCAILSESIKSGLNENMVVLLEASGEVDGSFLKLLSMYADMGFRVFDAYRNDDDDDESTHPSQPEDNRKKRVQSVIRRYNDADIPTEHVDEDPVVFPFYAVLMGNKIKHIVSNCDCKPTLSCKELSASILGSIRRGVARWVLP